MTAELAVDNIYNAAGSTVAYTSYMQRRVVQRVSYVHRLGYWYPDNNYYWLPGGYLDFTPIRNDTRLRWSLNCPMIWYGSAHNITHHIFYRDEIEYGRHSRSGHHTENANTQTWDIPTWGAGQVGRVGYRIRSYAQGNHSGHFWFTHYWDGGQVNWSTPGQIICEEYFPTV